MKKVIFSLAIGLSLWTSPGCKSDNEDSRIDTKNEISVDNVPAPVTTAFSAKHPQATEIAWEKAHENEIETFKVKFKEGNEYMKAEFGSDGSLLKEKKDD